MMSLPVCIVVARLKFRLLVVSLASNVLSHLGICFTVKRKPWLRLLYCCRWTDRLSDRQAQLSSSHLSLMPMSGWRSWLGHRAAGVRDVPWRWDTCGLIRFSSVFLALLRIPDGCISPCISTWLFANFAKDYIWHISGSITRERLFYRVVMEMSKPVWLGSDV